MFVGFFVWLNTAMLLLYNVIFLPPSAVFGHIVITLSKHSDSGKFPSYKLLIYFLETEAIGHIKKKLESYKGMNIYSTRCLNELEDP